MQKRGQITLYLLTAIVIIAILGFFIYINNLGILDMSQKNIEEEVDLYDLENDIRNYVQDCLKKTAIQGVLSLGLHGGTINENPNNLIIGNSFVNYGYSLGNNTLPSIETMEGELSNYIDIALDFCLDDFSAFNDKTKISYKGTSAKTMIKEKIFFEVEKPIEIIRDNSRIKFKDFRVEIPVRLKYIHELSNKIIEEEIKDKGWLPYDLMSTFDVNIAVYPHNKEVIVFSLIDNKSIINDQLFMFQFANKFDIVNKDKISLETEKLIPGFLRG
ncbi:hypothetical protein HYX17_00555 [Candidatus Woesearchaeota archaeon]|nr:hypothetical protein [Candidatus Woesearchaeota archaeon]